MPTSLPGSVQIQNHPEALLRPFFEENTYTQIAVLTDRNTQQHCYPLVKAFLPPHHLITVAPGEEAKNLQTCTEVWHSLTQLQFDRHALLLVLGGGVLGDLGGFCAATYKRGIDFVLMPTTLLAQVDASVGGKLGIDFEGLKNHIGVFQLPKSTLISPAFLQTLPPRELRSGFAEVIKHCLISDRQKWNEIKQKDLASQNWKDLIAHSVAFKEGVTQRDPKEKGERKILNFGHTVGHAIESLSLATSHRLFHGEAIALGMVAEAHIAAAKGLLTGSEVTDIEAFIWKIYDRVSLPPSPQVWEIMKQDKKNKGNEVLMALPKGSGSAVWDVAVSEKEVVAALKIFDSH